MSLPLFKDVDLKLTSNTELFEFSAKQNQIIAGEAKATLNRIPDNFVDAIVTSPPYYGQRDYSHEDQLGHESTPNDYVDRLVAICREARRVLKPSGTFWLNLGDKYQNGALCGLPWRVALALVEDGWILRSDIIWHKPNAMPSSVKTRPTVDHEYLFLLTKTDTYFYDADAIREPHVTFSDESQMRGGRGHFGKRGGTPEAGKNGGNPNLHTGRWDQAFHPKGRNKRTVWKISLSKYRDAHFAVFPEALVEPCILAGCPAKGVVLDPFFGAGTTGLVAQQHNRRFIGIEVNPSYCEMAYKRLHG
ncbi:DNA-methyltransferase [Brucella grignonensis]|uniref:Methyltransferase n=1 Tax=Brucella grignonensis TaxID=94627 RepID=A0A256FRG8_9HYPH|nr:site-specific DNA-methyltransferase [Brucella grignonensis]OYR17423.1 DNA methylase family protein [Brucella grignonensis]